MLGNEKADSAAKSARDLPHVKVGVRYCDFKHEINQFVVSTWKDDWNGVFVKTFHSVKPILGDWQSSYRQYGKDEIVLCRARIGHTHLTHPYIIQRDHPPRCILKFATFWWNAIMLLKQGRILLFGRRNVADTFRFHTCINKKI